MVYWSFSIEICVHTYSILLFISKKCLSFPKNISYFVSYFGAPLRWGTPKDEAHQKMRWGLIFPFPVFPVFFSRVILVFFFSWRDGPSDLHYRFWLGSIMFSFITDFAYQFQTGFTKKLVPRLNWIYQHNLVQLVLWFFYFL